MADKKILFFCQNLLGLGHFVRTSEILLHLQGRAKTCLVFGGQLADGLDMTAAASSITLPALRREDGELKVVGTDMALEQVQEFRRQRLLEAFRQFDPDVVVFEGFPFAKKVLAFELIPLLKEISRQEMKPAVFCSIREIVLAKERKAEKAKKTKKNEKAICKLMNKYFDGLLVHSDPRVLRLDERFSRLDRLNCPVHYTGFVVQSFPDTPPDAELSEQGPTILVSVGGGRLGRSLLEGILATAPLLASRIPHRLLVFTGPFLSDEEYARFAERAGAVPNLVVRRYTPSLLHHMVRADLSISLCGYNTAMNVLRANVRSMVLPSLKDLEQPLRAERFAEHGILEVLKPADLAPSIFADRIVAALARPKPSAVTFDLNGGATSAGILLNATRSRNVGTGSSEKAAAGPAAGRSDAVPRTVPM
jgi:predicted glycosyltransferase